MTFKVCNEPCNQCLFSKDKIVSNERRKQILDECKREDTHFICHKATIEGKEVCCRTFYDTRDTNLIRIAQRLNMVEFVNPTTGKPNGNQ